MKPDTEDAVTFSAVMLTVLLICTLCVGIETLHTLAGW